MRGVGNPRAALAHSKQQRGLLQVRVVCATRTCDPVGVEDKSPGAGE